MSSSYNFKDNLTIDNNKYLKWLDITGTSRASIISLDNSNNVNLNSAFGNLFLNSQIGNSHTFFNVNQNSGNVIVGSKMGIGFNTTSNMHSQLTLVNNSFIGLNTTTGSHNGYLGLAGSSSLLNTTGSRIMLYGIDSASNAGDLNLYSGNNANGTINLYTGNDQMRFQILADGTTHFIPDGITSRLIINNTTSMITNDLVITSTTQSHNASTGALQIRGGIGIVGNLYLDGTISLNNATGNINFDSSQSSLSYTSGAIFISGGIGISTTINSSSVTSGGAISIAGGAAIGKDVYIGGKCIILNSAAATSSQSASLVLYGGMGINGNVLSRSNDFPQIKLAPVNNGNETSVRFYTTNNYTETSNTGSSWTFGQNVNSIGVGNFAIANSQYGNVLSATYSGYINLLGRTTINNSINSTSVDDGGAFTVLGGASFKKDVFIGGVLNLGGGTISGGAGGSSEFGYLTLTSTEESVNLSSGSFVTFGGITIQCSTNSSSVTNGGSFLTAGGASIGKNLYIGGPILKIPVGNISQRPNPVESGSIRFNSETSQFEGYGPGNAWGSLGGVVDIAQTTKILASASPSTTDGNLYFYTVDNERMRINSQGNVGIGTTSPFSKLTVSGGNILLSGGNSTTRIIVQNSSTGTSIALSGLQLVHDGLLGGFLCNYENNPLHFINNGNNVRMIINTSGNVGIGLGFTNPIGKLHVSLEDATGAGNMAFWDNTYAVFGNTSNVGGAVGLGYHSVSGGSLSSIAPGSSWKDMNYRALNHRIYAGNESALALTINTSGNVGIGTTAPSVTLDVNGILRSNRISVNFGQTAYPVNIKDLGNDLIMFYCGTSTVGNIRANGPNPGITFNAFGTSQLVLGSTGNVGIGTTNPSATLDVVGGPFRVATQAHTPLSIEYFNSPGVFPYGNNATSGTNLLYGHDGGAFGGTYRPITIHGNVLNFSTGLSNYNLRLHIADDGYIGIGTSTPSYKLDVQGDARIKNDLYVDGSINGAAASSSTFAYLTLTSTDEAINYSSGSLVSFGGITIQCETEALDGDNGGSFLTAGGASIGKNLFVNSTQNATGLGTGGSLTIQGGASIGKDLYVGGTVTSASDIRLKKNIVPLKSEDELFIDKIDEIRTIKYNYISDESNTPYIGFIAQDFEKTFPELIKRPNPEGFYTLDYQKTTVILLECIKELKMEMKSLKTQLLKKC
jgi:fibronectin-binding autotransporter adhesin